MFKIWRELIRPPRRLTHDEIDALLVADVPARLATIDGDGFPHVTRLWFIWADGAFHFTSFSDRPHVTRLRRDPRAGVCIDLEQPQREDRERPNQQVRAIGNAELLTDEDRLWTARISEKYLKGAAALERIAKRPEQERIVILLRPVRVVAVGST